METVERVDEGMVPSEGGCNDAIHYHVIFFSDNGVDTLLLQLGFGHDGVGTFSGV